jgi:amino acid adenylation domain-containing protein
MTSGEGLVNGGQIPPPEGATQGKGSRGGPEHEPDRIQRGSGDASVSLSSAQRRMWFLHHLSGDRPVYNVQRAERLSGPLDVAALEKSLNEVVRRHEALRTTFPAVDGHPVPVVAPARPLHLSIVDLRSAPEGQQRAEVQRLAIDEARRLFDIGKGPLVRVKLLRLAPQSHVLLVTMPHILIDGWSMGVLFREQALLYGAYCAGEPSPLPDLSLQYSDFARWQEEHLEGEAQDHLLAYWRQQLAGAPPVLPLPTDRLRRAGQSHDGGVRRIRLGRDLTGSLKRLSQQSGSTLFMTLLAAFSALLHRYTQAEDIVIGSPIANRTRTELEDLIGFFVNTLPLRIDLSRDPSFRELLARVRRTSLDAFSHQDLPFEKLVEDLHPERVPGYSPLFQVMLVLQNAPAPPRVVGDLTLERLEIDIGVSHFDLTLVIREGLEGLTAEMEYRSELFEAGTVDRMLSHFQVLLEAVVADPDLRLHELPLLDEVERRQVLYGWNETRTDFPSDVGVHRLFERVAQQRQNAVAVVQNNRTLTYRQLDERANALAGRLQTAGAGPGALIGVLMERSLEWVVSLLAVLKTGAAYLPLSVDDPEERLIFMLRDAAVPILLVDPARAVTPASYEGKVVVLEPRWLEEAPQPEAWISAETNGVDPAYAMFTSGSTGLPKAAVIPHQAIARLVINTNYVRLQSDDVIAQLSSSAFDAATFEVWGALLNGARLVILDKQVAVSSHALHGRIRLEGITTLFLTTELFDLVATSSPASFEGVGTVLFGGDRADARTVGEVLRHGPPQRLINAYGPTEATTFATWHLINEVAPDALTIPIGRPIANTRIYVLDRHQAPVPIGVPGEIFIGGPGVALGYLGRPELTKERFVPDPFSGEQGARLFRTGDLGRLVADGSIEFLGRMDAQLKIRGFRVEPGEVEAVLVQHPDVREAVVQGQETALGGKRLVAFVVPEPGRSLVVQDLIAYGRAKLPGYMVPSAIVLMEALPLTATGKVDRLALPLPAPEPRSQPRASQPPRDELERQLIAVWESVLSVSPIGVKESFFDLGGHSLLAMRLFAALEKALGMRLPLAMLLEAPTVEDQARLIREAGWRSRLSSLVPIKPQGSRPPLYCMHWAGGQVLIYRELAALLAPDQPVYGVQAVGLERGQVPHTRIEDMAAHYIGEIRTLQPTGPYYLAGASMGGMIAFEMAQQLVAQGESVGIVALFDSVGEAQRPLPAMDRIRLHTRNLSVLDFSARLGYAVERSLNRINRSAYGIAIRSGLPLPPFMRSLKHISYQAARNYRPRPYPGKVTLFRAMERASGLEADVFLGWDRLALGGMEVHEIPGTHVTMLKEPGVRVLAEALSRCLTGEVA